MEGLVFELGCWGREFFVLRWRLVEIGWLCWRERDYGNGRCAIMSRFPTFVHTRFWSEVTLIVQVRGLDSVLLFKSINVRLGKILDWYRRCRYFVLVILDHVNEPIPSTTRSLDSR